LALDNLPATCYLTQGDLSCLVLDKGGLNYLLSFPAFSLYLFVDLRLTFYLWKVVR
jgi:hypothetical protein